jgi:hypothetical protein
VLQLEKKINQWTMVGLTSLVDNLVWPKEIFYIQYLVIVSCIQNKSPMADC